MSGQQIGNLGIKTEGINDDLKPGRAFPSWSAMRRDSAPERISVRTAGMKEEQRESTIHSPTAA